jgi:hypothetical protein
MNVKEHGASNARERSKRRAPAQTSEKPIFE